MAGVSPGPLTIYMSDHEGHVSILRVADLLYAREHLRAAGEAERIDALLDRLNQLIAERIQQLIAERIQLSGVAFVMTSKVRDRIVQKLSICSHRATLEDIDLVVGKL